MSADYDNDFQHYSDFTNVCIQVEETEILIPNLFVTTNNRRAEGFEIKGLEKLSDDSLYIVNRWGQEVYKSRRYKNNWTAEGLAEGNYYYLLMIKETESSKWESFKGYITLLRSKK